jgi:hypothetical protein
VRLPAARLEVWRPARSVSGAGSQRPALISRGGRPRLRGLRDLPGLRRGGGGAHPEGHQPQAAARAVAAD